MRKYPILEKWEIITNCGYFYTWLHNGHDITTRIENGCIIHTYNYSTAGVLHLDDVEDYYVEQISEKDYSKLSKGENDEYASLI